MNKNFLSGFILVFALFISGAIIGLANAQTPSPQSQEGKIFADIQYPIPELGNCKSKKDCKAFCDNSEHADACLSFAEQHNLMSTSETAAAKKFIDSGSTGPGGCKGQAECDQYCGNSTHLEECITFAQKNGMMSDQELQDSQKVLTAVKNGLKPPACAGPKQCDAYCGNPLHMEECMAFSIAAGLVPDAEKEQMQKMLDALKKGIKPPDCRGPKECDAYCGSPEHMQECMAFSLEAGMVPDKEKEQMQKTLDALKQGIKPPACQPNRPGHDQRGQQNQPGRSGDGPNQGQGFNPGSGQNSNGPRNDQGGDNDRSDQPRQASRFDQTEGGLESCDQYCGDPSHIEECVKFSVAVGNMTEQQAQTAIKTGGKGPGGCVGREACNAFCGNPDNQETCFQFGKENGMIPEEDLQRMEEGQQKMKDSFSSIPPEVLDCLTSSLGADVVEKMKTGSVTGRQFGDAINQCFQKFSVFEGTPNGNGPGNDQDGQGQQGQGGPGQGGPNQGRGFNPGSGENGNGPGNGQGGGNGQPGQNQFGPGGMNPGGQRMPQQAGPGGCKGPEECQKYCDSNPEVCKNFQPPQNQGQPNQNGGPNQGQGFHPGSGENGNGPGRGQDGANGQPGQFNQRAQQNQQGQFGQPGQRGPGQGGTDGTTGLCGTGPGTCLGIGPDDRNPNNAGGFNQGQGFHPGFGENGNGPGFGQPSQMQPNQPGQFNQPGQMQFGQPGQFQGQPGEMQPAQPNQQIEMQSQQQPQPPAQQEPPPPPPSSFLQTVQKLLGNVLSAFR